MTVPRSNPFVGPRPFEIGETIYGRDRELDRLTDLLIAERIVLLYSPSGAGKTSLINAGLLPRMSDEGFVTLPAARVNLDPGEMHPKNRYVFSALVSLEKLLEEDQQTPLDQLAQLTLEEYLQPRKKPANDEKSSTTKQVLFFDQFEEILTVEPNDVEGKTAFFKQIGDALYNPRVWALFAMREDFIAALDPYLRFVPSRLTNRFRLDLLDAGAARQAIQKPAKSQGVDFTDEAAEKLINDLRKVKLVGPTGETSDDLGTYIEPVQMQVVCFELWKRISDDDNTITEDEIYESGDVDSSLGSYYAQVMDEITPVISLQRMLREWFEKDLITTISHLRNQVLLDERLVNRLGIANLERLENAHLVRRETRHNRIWFEISHDRMVEPIWKNNNAWFQANLNVLQRQAALWQEQDHPDHLLLRDQALVDAEAWATSTQQALTPIEEKFLIASLEIRQQEETARLAKEKQLETEKQRANEQARFARRLSWLVIGLGVVVLIALGLAVFAFNAQRTAADNATEAQRQARKARTGELLALARDARDLSPQRSLLLSLEAIKRTQNANEPVTPSERQALFDAIKEINGVPLAEHTGNVTVVLFSETRGWLITASVDGTALVWDLTSGAFPKRTFRLVHLLANSGDQRTLRVMSGAISKDERWLATGCDDGSIWLWDLSAADPSESPRILRAHNDQIRTLDFSLDNHWLASGGWDGRVYLWDLMTGTPGESYIRLDGHAANARVVAVAFSPDKRWLASAGEDKTVRLWEMETPVNSVASAVLSEHTGKVGQIAFSPDGNWLASAGEDQLIKIWSLQAAAPVSNTFTLEGHTDVVSDLAFSPDSHLLASASGDTTIRVWDFQNETVRKHPIVLRGHRDSVKLVAFNKQGLLASGSLDRTARLWDVFSRDPSANPVILKGHDDLVRVIKFNPDGSWLATASADNTVRLWALNQPDPNTNPVLLKGHDRFIRDIEFSPNGQWLASAGDDSITLFWNMAANNPAENPITLAGHRRVINDLAFSPDGKWYATAGGDKLVQLLSLSTTNSKKIMLDGHSKTVNTVAFSNDGRWLATASDDATGRLWRLETSHPERDSILLQGHTAEVNHLSISPDGHWVATASNDNSVRLWNLWSPDPAANPLLLLGHTKPIHNVAFSPDGHWLASASEDTTLRLWDLTSSDPTSNFYILDGHDALVWDVEFSPDGRWVATASPDDTAQLWDLSKEAIPTTPVILRGHSNEVVEVTFDHSGRWLATVGKDHNAILWDLSLADPAANPIYLNRLPYQILDVAFSPNGHWLAVAGSDTTIQLWRVNLDELITLACNLAGRNLAKKDWGVIFQGEEYQKTCPQWPEK